MITFLVGEGLLVVATLLAFYFALIAAPYSGWRLTLLYSLLGIGLIVATVGVFLI